MTTTQKDHVYYINLWHSLARTLFHITHAQVPYRTSQWIIHCWYLQQTITYHLCLCNEKTMLRIQLE